MQEISALAWVAAVSLSAFGLGRAVTWAGGLTAAAGETGCYGLAILIAIGGALNCLGWAVPAVNIVLVLPAAFVGLAWLARTVPWRIALNGGAVTTALRIVFLLLAVFAVVTYLYNYSFFRDDDAEAYMAFPVKMLTGSLGFEPFSERRLVTSLGGLYYLQSVILTGASIPWLHAIDPSFAVVLTLLVLNDALRQRCVSDVRRYGVLLFLLLFLPLVRNLTAGLLQVPFLILLCLSREVTGSRGPRAEGKRFLIPTALLTSAVIAIKPLQLPFLFFVLVGNWGARFCRRSQRGKVVTEALTTGGATLGLLLMWLTGNALQVGTPLYPLLGMGNITSRHNPAILPLASMTPLWDRLASFFTTGLFNAPVLLMMGLFLAFSVITWRGREPHRILLPGFCVIGTLAVDLAICLGGAGELNLVRYLYPCVVASILFLLVAFPRVGLTAAARNYSASIFVVAACALAVAGQSREVLGYYRTGLLNLRILYSGPSPVHADFYDTFHRYPGANAEAIQNMQAAVPTGEALMERVDYPYLMDFYRNTVFITDWPGSTGPAPGWPLHEGAAALAAYLAQVGVHYIAYSYNQAAVRDVQDLENNSRDAWIQSDLARVLEFQGNVAVLSSICPVIFRDTRRLVVHITDECIAALPKKA